MSGVVSLPPEAPDGERRRSLLRSVWLVVVQVAGLVAVTAERAWWRYRSLKHSALVTVYLVLVLGECAAWWFLADRVHPVGVGGVPFLGFVGAPALPLEFMAVTGVVVAVTAAVTGNRVAVARGDE